MNSGEMLRQAKESYSRGSNTGEGVKLLPFPAPPSAVLPPGDFFDRLLEAAFECSPKLRHSFAIRLVRGGWNKKQIREWVRQDYQRTVVLIRRHALLAANSPDYETIWGLLTRVKAEADADLVSGTFFALPQLWIKFGIALGMSREEITGYRPHPLLGIVNESMLDEVRFSTALPVGEFVDALLDPVFYGIWGEALGASLGINNDALDFFRAIEADRWGEETGRKIFERLAVSHESQTELWNRYRSEVERGRERERFTILEGILEGVPA